MSKRIKVGDVYLDLADNPSARPVRVIAEKGEMSAAIEPVAFSNPAPDLVSLYIAGTAGNDQSKRASAPAEAALDRMTAWQAFAGPKSVHPQLWLRYVEGKARHCGFNKWAFLFGLQWFLFNKMFVQALLVAVVEVGSAVLGLVACFRAPALMHDPRAVLLIQWMCLTVGCGLPRLAVAYWANLALFGTGLPFRHDLSNRGRGLKAEGLTNIHELAFKLSTALYCNRTPVFLLALTIAFLISRYLAAVPLLLLMATGFNVAAQNAPSSVPAQTEAARVPATGDDDPSGPPFNAAVMLNQFVARLLIGLGRVIPWITGLGVEFAYRSRWTFLLGALRNSRFRSLHLPRRVTITSNGGWCRMGWNGSGQRHRIL